MSGIAGMLRFDSRPTREVVLERMATRLAHRGPDGARVWCDHSVGLVYLMLCTTPESVGEVQPAADATGRFHIVFDGRIDNRSELRSLLQLRGIDVRGHSDAESWFLELTLPGAVTAPGSWSATLHLQSGIACHACFSVRVILLAYGPSITTVTVTASCSLPRFNPCLRIPPRQSNPIRRLFPSTSMETSPSDRLRCIRTSAGFLTAMLRQYS